MDDFYIEESNPKQILIKCILFIFVLGMIVGVFYYYNENAIRLKKVTLELGTELSKDINDYVLSGQEKIFNYKLDLSEVNKDLVGKYTYKVKYNKNVKTGTIIIKDTTKPVVETTNVEMNINDELEARLLVANCKDLSLPCTVSFKKEEIIENFKQPGTYEVEIIVSDAAGNTVDATSKVTTSDKASLKTLMSSDLEYFINSENDDTLEKTLFEKFDKAYEDDSKEFTTIIQEVSTIDFNEYAKEDIYSARLITAYNKYGYAIGIQVIVTYYDGTIDYLTKGEA